MQVFTNFFTFQQTEVCDYICIFAYKIWWKWIDFSITTRRFTIRLQALYKDVTLNDICAFAVYNVLSFLPWQVLRDYMMTNHGATHNWYTMELLNIFECSKQTEKESFKDLGNRLVLWWYFLSTEEFAFSPHPLSADILPHSFTGIFCGCWNNQSSLHMLFRQPRRYNQCSFGCQMNDWDERMLILLTSTTNEHKPSFL